MRIHATLMALIASLLVASSAVTLAQDEPAAADPVAAAAYATVATGSIGFDLLISVRGGRTVISIGASGAVDLGADQRGWFTMDLSAAGLPPAEVIIDGRFAYLRGGGWTDALEPGAWFGVDLASTDPAVDEFRQAVSDTDDAPLILYWLLGATEPPTYVGADSLDGDAVDHFALTVDLDDAVRVVPDEFRQLMKDNVYQFRTRGFEPLFETEVWIDGRGMVRRASYSFVYRPTDVDELRFTWDFHDFGVPVELVYPDPADVIPVGDSQLPPSSDPDDTTVAAWTGALVRP